MLPIRLLKSTGCILSDWSAQALSLPGSVPSVAAIVILRSRHRWWGLVLAMIGSPILFLALPAELQNRFETIVNPEVGPKNAQVSGEGRLEGLSNGYELLMANPATGCGPGAWRPATHSKIESHNLYGQLMGEMGMAGIMTFGCILACFGMNLYWMKQHCRMHPDERDSFAYHLAGAVGMGIFLMLFEGNFGHNLFRHNWLWYGGFLIVARHCVEVRPAPATYVYSARVSWQGAYAA